MKDTEYLFPKYRVTLGQVKECKGMTLADAARHLKISPTTFGPKIRYHQLRDLFAKNEGAGYFMPKHKVTLEKVMECTHMTMQEASFHFNASYSGFWAAARKFNISHLFLGDNESPSCATAKKKTKPDMSKGFGVDLIEDAVNCMNPKCDEIVNFKYFPGMKPDRRRFCTRCKGRSNYYEEESQLPRC